MAHQIMRGVLTGLAKIPGMLDLDGDDAVYDSEGAKHRHHDVELADVKSRHCECCTKSPIDEMASS